MDVKEWAKSRAIVLAESVKFFIREGVDKKTALWMVKRETTIGAEYWKEVLDLVG